MPAMTNSGLTALSPPDFWPNYCTNRALFFVRLLREPLYRKRRLSVLQRMGQSLRSLALRFYDTEAAIGILTAPECRPAFAAHNQIQTGAPAVALAKDPAVKSGRAAGRGG